MALIDLIAEKYKGYLKQYERKEIKEGLINLAMGKNPKLIASKYTLLMNMASWRKEIPWNNENTINKVMGVMGFIYGPVGQFLLMCEDNINPQFLKEFERLFANKDTFISNHFLFYIAAAFRRNGYGINFISEEKGKKTPDFTATYNSQKIYIEATANRSDTSKINVPGIIWNSIQEKQTKFEDTRFHPGLIAIDLGEQVLSDNKTNYSRKYLSEDGRWYDEFKDKDFCSMNPCSDSIKAVEYFKKIRNDLKINYVWMLQSNILELDGDEISWPQRDLMIQSKEAKDLVNIGGRTLRV